MSDLFDFKQMRERVSSKASEMEERFPLQKVRFLPWVGTRYDSSSLRLLILGESTYHDKNWLPEGEREAKRLSDEAIAICEVGRMLKAGFYRPCKEGKPLRSTGNFMRNIVTYVTGDNSISGEKFVKVWEDWAFWELIQDRLENAKSRPSKLQFREGWCAFERLLPAFKPKPDLVIGLGYRMRDSLRMLPDKLPSVVGEDNLFEYKPTGLRILFLKHPSCWLNPLEQHKRFTAIRDALFQGSNPADHQKEQS